MYICFLRISKDTVCCVCFRDWLKLLIQICLKEQIFTENSYCRAKDVRGIKRETKIQNAYSASSLTLSHNSSNFKKSKVLRVHNAIKVLTPYYQGMVALLFKNSDFSGITYIGTSSQWPFLVELNLCIKNEKIVSGSFTP